MVFGKKKADAARGTAKTLAPIPGKAFGVSGKQKKATGAALPGKASVSETDSQDGKKRNRLLLILAAMGPGIVTAMAGNDAGGISTYSTAGAKFGFTTLWVIPIMCILLIVVQTTASRMGATTGKGFAALIRERFGIRLAALAMFALLVGNKVIHLVLLGNSVKHGLIHYFVNTLANRRLPTAKCVDVLAVLRT